jgi:urease accessory protein
MKNFAFLVAMLAASPVLAHHPMGGTAPATFVQGVLGGLAHPVIGIDHLAMIVLVGLAAAMAGRALAAPAVFIAATVAGTLVHLGGVDLPMAEGVILASVVVVGALLAGGQRLAGTAALIGFGVAGTFHGWAYGEAVIGAEPMPILAYLTGFAIVQLAIAHGVARLALHLASRPEGRLQARLAAAVCLGVGLALMGETIEAALLAG